MLELVQLENGCYRLTVEYVDAAVRIRRVYVFRELLSRRDFAGEVLTDLKPLENGERIVVRFSGE